MSEDKLMYLHDAADYLGKARYTLQKWDRDDNAATNLYEYPELDWNSNKN